MKECKMGQTQKNKKGDNIFYISKQVYSIHLLHSDKSLKKKGKEYQISIITVSSGL